MDALKSPDLRAHLTSYLSRHGWETAEDGTSGDLWRPANDSPASRFLAVPFAIEPDSFEFESVVARLARWSGVEAQRLAETVGAEFTDTQNYRIADAHLRDDAAPLDGAASLISSAKRIVRAAATTARKPRAQIGANYSKPGDAVASTARLAHTRRGSFILPIEMPVSPPAATDGQLDDAEVEIEPVERSVTRTVASALAAVNALVIQPASEPGKDEVMALVQSGVSKELATAIRDAAVGSGVGELDVKFQWSPALGAPKNIPKRVVIPDDASVRLNNVISRLGQMKAEPDATVSGQIVRIHYVPGEPQGEISIRTERRGRQVDIGVTVSDKIAHKAFDWARDHRAVLANGQIQRAAGKPLTMPSPTSVLPVDTLFNRSN